MRSKFFLVIFLLFCSPAWGGYDCDGTDDHIDLPIESSFTNGVDSGPLTFSCWIDADGSQENSEGRIFAKGGSGYLIMGLLDSGAAECSSNYCLNFVVDYTTADLRSAASGGSVGSDWTHVAVTWNGGTSYTTDVVLYVNGSSVSVAAGLTPSGSLVTDANGEWEICNNASPGVRAFNGKVSECAAWNVVLTSSEIAQLAKSRTKRIPLQIRPTNLSAYYPLDETPDGNSGDAQTIYDLGPDRNNGTGNDGANNTGLTAVAESILSYP